MLLGVNIESVFMISVAGVDIVCVKLSLLDVSLSVLSIIEAAAAAAASCPCEVNVASLVARKSILDKQLSSFAFFDLNLTLIPDLDFDVAAAEGGGGDKQRGPI